MIIIKKNNHIDETKLDKREAIIFIRLLKDERCRHIREIHQANLESWIYEGTCELISKFWKLQEMNHHKDIDMIDKCIDYLKEKFRIV